MPDKNKTPDNQLLSSISPEERDTLENKIRQEAQEVIDERRKSTAADQIPALDYNNPDFSLSVYDQTVLTAVSKINMAIIQYVFVAPAIWGDNDKFDDIEVAKAECIKVWDTVAENIQIIIQAETTAKGILSAYSEAFINKVAALDPYIRYELKEYTEIDKTISGYTVDDIYSKGFTVNGDIIDSSVFAPVIKRAIKRKMGYEAAEKSMELAKAYHRQNIFFQDFAAISATVKPIEGIDYPLDKPNREIWDLLTDTTFNPQLRLSTITIDTSKGDKKREAAVIYGIDFGSLEKEMPGLKTSKQLTSYDKRVYIAVAGLYNADNKLMAVTQIYRAMGNKGNPSTKECQKINDSLSKMGAARIYIDNSYEADKYSGYPAFVYDASLLPFERLTATINGQTTTVIRPFREPPMVKFARERKQIAHIPLAALQSPMNKTESNLRIDDYLLENISRMKGKRKRSQKILYDTLYKNCKITTKKQKQRAPEKIRKYLDHYTSSGYIKGYKEEADGIYIQL